MSADFKPGIKLRVYRWGFYVLVPGRLHVLVQPRSVHVCRAR